MNIIKDKESIGRILYNSSLISILCLSMGACTPIGIGNATVIAIITGLFCNFIPKKTIYPTYLEFLILMFVINKTGLSGAALTIVISAVLKIIFNHCISINKHFEADEIKAAFMLGTAFSLTVLMTDYYFGIGASGDTVLEMLKSYRSLGFHPNWRGILYGTIVMVVMITFPRKFKTAFSKFSAALTGVIITILTNIFLIPKDYVSPITLISKSDFIFNLCKKFTITGDYKFIYIILISSVALSLVSDINKNVKNNKNAIYESGKDILCSEFGLCLTDNSESNEEIRIFERFITLILTAIINLILISICRIPLASLAVVLIVGGWQSMEWKYLKLSFKSFIKMFCFILLSAIFIFTTPALGIICGFIYGSVKNKTVSNKQ